MDENERKRTAKTDDEKLRENKRKEGNQRETNIKDEENYQSQDKKDEENYQSQDKKDEENYQSQDVISRLTRFQLAELIVERVWAKLDWKSMKNASFVNKR